MLASRLSASQLFWFKKVTQGSELLHQYHSHNWLCSHALAPPALQKPFKFSTVSTRSVTSNSRLHQIAQHFSTESPRQIAMGYTVRKLGQPNTLDHRVYIEKDGVVISPFHDIPLYANEQQTVLNMIVEIPRWTNAKMEVRNLQRQHLSIYTYRPRSQKKSH